MLTKRITSKEEMFEKLKKGISIIAAVVKRTLGPGGLPILIERSGQNLEGDPLEPMITKDGVTVAAECWHPDPEVDLTIQTVKAICRKTNRIAGDGTTTAIVLGESIFLETLKELQKKSNFIKRLFKEDQVLNPQLVKEKVEASVQRVVEKLYQSTLPCDTLDDIERVAIISANGEKEIGQVIREAFDHVGPEGVVTIDEGSVSETTIQKVEGFQFQRGAEAQERFFNNKEATKFEAQNILVVIYDGRISHNGQLIPIMNKIFMEHKKIGSPMIPPVLIIANEFSVDTIQLLLVNRAEAGLSVCAVKGPNTTSVRTQMLDDLAVYLGGSRLGNGNKNLESADFGIKVVDGHPEYTGDVGFAKSVAVDKYTTTFYGGGGTDDQVKERIDQLKASKEFTFSDYDKTIINDRVAALARGIAKILVGGRTDLEIKEKYHRIEDALNSARAAIEGGVIAGGGATLFRIAKDLESSLDLGDQILSRALKAPLFQIIENIGMHNDEVNLEALSNTNPFDLNNSVRLTFDARNREIVDAFNVGIIDPVKVTVTALQNAASIANLLATCGGGITYSRNN